MLKSLFFTKNKTQCIFLALEKTKEKYVILGGKSQRFKSQIAHLELEKRRKAIVL